MNHTAMRLITPSRPASRVQYVMPNKAARPKIGQIDRLAETARLVFDPNKDDSLQMSPLDRERQHRINNSRVEEESSEDTDSEIVHPGDDNSSSDSADPSKFSYQPVRPLYGQQPPGIRKTLSTKTKLTQHPPDYFLNKPTKSAETRERKIMGYNPLNFLRQPANKSPLKLSQKPNTDNPNNSDKVCIKHFPISFFKYVFIPLQHYVILINLSRITII